MKSRLFISILLMLIGSINIAKGADRGKDIQATDTPPPAEVADTNIETLCKKVIELLNDNPHSDSTMLLHQAASEGNLIAVQLLLTHSAYREKINSPDVFGNTPLHRAAIAGHIDVAELLLENDAKINTLNKKGRSALYFASLKGHAILVQLFTACGADTTIFQTDIRLPINPSLLRIHATTKVERQA